MNGLWIGVRLCLLHYPSLETHQKQQKEGRVKKNISCSVKEDIDHNIDTPPPKKKDYYNYLLEHLD